MAARAAMDASNGLDIADRTRVAASRFTAAPATLVVPGRCRHAGSMLDSGYLGYIPKDGRAALIMYEKGWGLRDIDLGHAVAYLFERGSRDGMVKANLAKALAMYKKNCAANSVHSCANLSDMYDEGRGVKKNRKLARKYMERAEELGLSPP